MELKSGYVILAGGILFGLICVTLTGLPPLVLYPVAGTSMEPVLFEGDSVAILPVMGHNACIGDIIVFRSPIPTRNGDCPLIAHRIVEIRDETYRTKGDNRTAPDPFEVNPASVQGVVWLIIPHNSPPGGEP